MDEYIDHNSDENISEVKPDSKKTITIGCPVNGRVETIDKTPDEAFSQGFMGNGVVIFPKNNIVYAPVDSTVMNILPTKHAVGLVTDEGIEILIHIGIDTVKLNGEGFDVFVKEGDKLKRGDKILAFNMKYIKENATSDAIPIVFTDNNDIRLINGSAVYKANEDMLEIETE